MGYPHPSITHPFITLHNPQSKHSVTSPTPTPTPPPKALSLSQSLITSTISKSPSDTISLLVFLWFSRQPGGHRSLSSAHHLLDELLLPLRRLTLRFPSIPSLLSHLCSVGCRSSSPQTLLVLLRLYWRARMFLPALEAFDEMSARCIVPNTFAHNIALDILFNLDRPIDALRLLAHIPSTNFLSYSVALRHVCKADDWRTALSVLSEMVWRRFRLNQGCFRMGFDCLKKGRRMRELFQFLGFMVVSGTRPSVEICTILIDGLCYAGEVDEAWRLLGKISEPTVVTYTSMIRGFFAVGEADRVFGVLDLMLSRGCSPDLVLYNVLIDSLSKEGRYNDAINIFFGLRQREITPDAYTLSSLMSMLCSSGKLRLLPNLIGGLFVPFDLVACNSLLNVLCKAGFPSEAVKFYDDMIARGFSPDNYSYVGLLNSLCKLKGNQRVVSVYREIVANDPNADTYVHSTVFGGLVRNGKCHLAVRLFREAVSEIYALDVVSYTIAIHGLLRGRRFEEARNLFDKMKQVGVVPNVYTYNVMLRGLCRTRDIDAVKKLLRSREVDRIQMDAISFNAIISLLVRTRRFNSAFLVFMNMCDIGVRPNKRTYSLLYNGAKHIRLEDADDLYPRLMHYFEDDDSVDVSLRNMSFRGFDVNTLSNSLTLEQTIRSMSSARSF